MTRLRRCQFYSIRYRGSRKGSGIDLACQSWPLCRNDHAWMLAQARPGCPTSITTSTAIQSDSQEVGVCLVRGGWSRCRRYCNDYALPCAGDPGQAPSQHQVARFVTTDTCPSCSGSCLWVSFRTPEQDDSTLAGLTSLFFRTQSGDGLLSPPSYRRLTTDMAQ